MNVVNKVMCLNERINNLANKMHIPASQLKLIIYSKYGSNTTKDEYDMISLLEEKYNWK